MMMKHKPLTLLKLRLGGKEIHMDLVGPINPSSRKGHKYFLTIVDSNVPEIIALAVSLEAKRIGYYPTVIHSHWGTEFVNSNLTKFCNENQIQTRQEILEDTGVNKRLWNEMIKTSALVLNQIPAHKSKASPFEMFKGRSLPLSFFKPGSMTSSDPTRYMGIMGASPIPNISTFSVSLKKDPSQLMTQTYTYKKNQKSLLIVLIKLTLSNLMNLKKKASMMMMKLLNLISCLMLPLENSENVVVTSNLDEWSNTAEEELNNIECHNVWEDMFEEPKSYLKTTWTFKTKPSTLSSAKKNKVRLCIQGFLQIPGQDYNNTFAFTGKFTSLLITLMFSIDKKLPSREFDVKSAFLFAPLKEEVYIRRPEGPPSNWFETLTNWFTSIYLIQSTADPCLYLHKNKNSFIFFHVDDLAVIGDVTSFKKKFLDRFPNSSAHEPDTLLGMDLTYNDSSVKLSQKKLIEKGLEMAGILTCRKVSTPLSLKINYRYHTGILNYLACRTCPNLAPAVSMLSSYNNAPGIKRVTLLIYR
ncbi:hypothetical protein VP01_1223g3 [Puccinia sorghi]|uniref:Reverse transcriptase Ty1/copia-type domain-containing protein n=1 Tax=Puccinia sorghi TaxID=27349 RepID=A0A0L6VPZ1_9BASI|nr:hypothetical protein VP01_1223g3 [Puccinia sorghi]